MNVSYGVGTDHGDRDAITSGNTTSIDIWLCATTAACAEETKPAVVAAQGSILSFMA
jgi:hypothetical protein